MNALIPFTVYDADGNPLRWGYCSEDDIILQPDPDAGEGVIDSYAGDQWTHKVIIPKNGAIPYLRERSAEDAAAIKATFMPKPRVSDSAAAVAALMAKGIITKADLEAARQSKAKE